MPYKIPGIDTEAVFELYEDEEVYRSILHTFVSRIPALLDKIRNVSSDTLPDYLIKIHALKGSSGSIGAKEIMAAAANLEAMAKKGDLAGILTENVLFLERTGVLVDDIRTWLEQSDASA